MATEPSVVVVAGDEREVLLNALDAYVEWALDAADDKRTEFEAAGEPGLAGEAAHYERDVDLARNLIERLGAGHQKGRDCARTEEVLDNYRRRALAAEAEVARLREVAPNV